MLVRECRLPIHTTKNEVERTRTHSHTKFTSNGASFKVTLILGALSRPHEANCTIYTYAMERNGTNTELLHGGLLLIIAVPRAF